MAKRVNKTKLYEAEIEAVIIRHMLFTITDIFAFYTTIKRAQFYNLKLDKSDTIKKALEDNTIKAKQSLRNKWFKSGNATLQIALFKLICDEEEAARLNTQRHDVTTKAEQPVFDMPPLKKK